MGVSGARVRYLEGECFYLLYFLRSHGCNIKAIFIFHLKVHLQLVTLCDSCAHWYQLSGSHFSALGDSDILDRLVCYVGPDILDLSHDVHAINNLSEDDMLVVEMR